MKNSEEEGIRGEGFKAQGEKVNRVMGKFQELRAMSYEQ
jgi:hypothetical protein